MPTATRDTRFIDDYLSYLLARASQAVYKEFEKTVNAAGLASLEWRVLATLNDVESMTIGDLAREVLAKQPTLTKLIQRMRDAGWVDCSADADDARRTRVAATLRGRRTIERLMMAAKAHEAEALVGFSAGQVETLKAVLRTLIDRPEIDN